MIEPWWQFRPRVNAADLLEVGACAGVVNRYAARMGDADTVEMQKPELSSEYRNYLDITTNANGEGYGSGYGDN